MQSEHEPKARSGGGRRRLIVAVVLAVVLAVPGAVFGYFASQHLERDAVAHFTSAQAHLERARTLAAQATGPRALATLAQARRQFQSARADFAAAGSAVTGTPARLVPAQVPLAGPRLAAVQHLSAMGLALCDAGLRSLDIDAEFLTPPAAGEPTGTARLLTILKAIQGTLPALDRDLASARAHLAAIDSSVVPAAQRASLQKAGVDVARAVTAVAELGRLVPAIGDILGVDGRHTYVVEQVNPFELRVGGGYIGTYSLLAADHGTLSVLRSGDTHDLPDFSTFSGQPGYVTPPGPLQGLLNGKSFSFEDTNFYPDFRDDARAAEQFAQRDFGTPVDGVISIDLYGVAALLGVTGPIAVPGYPVTLTKDNAVGTMVAADLQDPQHKRVISSVAGPLMQRLVALDSGQWLGVIQILNDLANSRHLQLSFTSPQAQSEIERLGLSGQVAAAGHDDYLNLGEANFGGNKANYFLTRTLDLTLTRTGATLHHVLTENLTYDLTHAPDYYIVPYVFFDRLLLPASATGIQASGLTPENPPSITPPTGLTVFEGRATLRADQQNRVVHGALAYAWDTPWSLDAAGAHVVYWQKQAGVAQDAITVTWVDGSSRQTAKSDLGTDRLVTLSGQRVEVAQGNAAQVSLPRL